MSFVNNQSINAETNGSSFVFSPGDTLPNSVLADLRTDHAGETGAVFIYLGILQFTRNPALRVFAEHHLVTEQSHLRHIESWLPKAHYSRLLPLWRLAGFITGALPALISARAVYVTIQSVETFVNQHYDDQVRSLESKPALAELRQILLECQSDEVAHRDQAAAALGQKKTGVLLRFWSVLVGAGSQAAVAVCRYI
jgi:ubiquinone biosynthesis monooxygenase Coq7